MSEYNPNAPGKPNGNFFGMPYSVEESALVIISVPWDVTTSYRPGTSKAPEVIMDASLQLDFYDYDNPGGWKKGIGTAEIDYSILATSRKLREDAEKVIIHLESGGSPEEDYARKRIGKINEASEQLNKYVYEETDRWLQKGKRTAILGGDHSVPYGHIKALSEHEGGIGILHIDAHADLRNAYEGFTHSHASIMYNAAKLAGVDRLVQVAVRDISEEEVEFIASSDKVRCFSDYELTGNRAAGMSWKEQCDEIINELPEKVYISFDIDGLNPVNCPGTGTPVPGGLNYNEAMYLLRRVSETGKTIVGFDVCEVAPHIRGEWDANVGARVLYKLCNLILK